MFRSAKKPKLPGLNIRGSSSRHDWDSVGTIKFFTDKDGDISGLDEAMRTISMGTRQSGEANVHSPSSHVGYQMTKRLMLSLPLFIYIYPLVVFSDLCCK